MRLWRVRESRRPRNGASLGFDDAKDEMIRLEELEAAKKEVEKVTGEKPISQKMFKAI